MSHIRTIPLIHLTLLLAAAVATAPAQAGSSNSAATSTSAAASTPAPAEDQHVAADAATKRLLTLMDTDKSGKVSKQEFLSYMESEFDRLDTNKDGELDVAELTKLHMKPGVGVHR